MTSTQLRWCYMDKREKLTTILLWVGGVPPVLSGILAMVAPGWYLSLTGITEILSAPGNQAFVFLGHLQGGDAWVAGTARIAVALLGSLALKRAMVLIMLLHSSYELWLIPSRAISWCVEQQSVCTPFYLVELWAFIALHLVLVIGSLLLLTVPQERKKRISETYYDSQQ